jgi:hypothetical protein
MDGLRHGRDVAAVRLRCSHRGGSCRDPIGAGRQTEAWNRGDLDAYMEGYARDDQTMFVGSTVTRGWQTVRDRYRAKYDTVAKMGTLAFSDLALRPLSPLDVLVTGAWELMRQGDHPQGRFTLLFHRTAVGWRIVYDHSS